MLDLELKPGLELLPGYRLERYLGRGGFGEVWMTTAPGGLFKALKVAPMDSDDPLQCRELEGLNKIREIRHPYLLSIERYEIIDRNLIIVMELADKSLADLYSERVRAGGKGIDRDELLHYLKEAAEVLDLLNSKYGLQHLDIKPENLFVCSGHVKVADFGLVQPKNASLNQSTLAISPPYAPPELFEGKITPTADQYSLAITYQELLTGFRPFSASDVRGLLYQHMRGRPYLNCLPPCDRQVITRAIHREPSRRFNSCQELIETLDRAAVFGTPMVDAQSAPTPAPPMQMPRPTPSPAPRSKLLAAAQVDEVKGRSLAENLRWKPRIEETTVKTEIVPSLDHRKQADTANVLPADQNAIEHRSTFIAFLPMEIFAHKLRGFIDTLGVELVHCDEDSAVLRLHGTSWFWAKAKSMSMRVSTHARAGHAGYRVVDVSIWMNKSSVDPSVFGRRAALLIRCLKCFLMANDVNRPLVLSEAALRSQLFAGL